jgi:transposase
MGRDEPMIPDAAPRGETRDRGGDPVSAARGLFVAAAAAHFPPVADGLPSPASLGARRGLGEGSSHAGHGGPGARRSRSFALRSHHPPPDRQDGGSKGALKSYDQGRPWPRRGRVSAPNGKKIHGRKRHILTDTDGRLFAVEVNAADIQDPDGAKGVLKRSRRSFPFVQTVFAGGGYAGRLVKWARNKTHVSLEIVRRMPWMKGFVVIRRRWIVERSFAWIMKCRRLARDYEQLAPVVETLITIAAAATRVRRWPWPFLNALSAKIDYLSWCLWRRRSQSPAMNWSPDWNDVQIHRSGRRSTHIERINNQQGLTMTEFIRGKWLTAASSLRTAIPSAPL